MFFHTHESDHADKLNVFPLDAWDIKERSKWKTAEHSARFLLLLFRIANVDSKVQLLYVPASALLKY